QFVVPGGVLLFHENRDARYMYLYVVDQHPLLDRTVPWPRRIMVYIQDTQRTAREMQWKYEDSIKVPLGHDEEMDRLGGTYPLHLFCPMAYLIQNLKKVQEIVLGERILRDCLPAVKTDNGYEGGVAYEHQEVKGIHGSRCYSAGPTHQRSQNMTSPTASGKVPDGGMTPALENRKFVIKTTVGAGVASMNIFAPEKFREQLRNHAELTNMPRVGGIDNVYFPAIQFNFAAAVAGEESLSKALPSMKIFGTEHMDGADDAGGLTSMIANSDIPDDYEYGRFHLLAFGCWIKLTPLRIMTFSGLFKHGGSPPLSPKGVSPVPWAYRFMTVLYPPKSMLSGAGNQVIGFAAHYFSLLLQLRSDSPSSRGVTNESNWARDGEVLMDPPEQFQFYSRSLLQINTYLLRQLPVEMQARI
ncbi:hypothetical protein FPV67DRAFT_1365498, partial [Lyophyllum atratum]